MAVEEEERYHRGESYPLLQGLRVVVLGFKTAGVRR